MASNATLSRTEAASSSDFAEVHAIIQVIVAPLIALTIIESIMILVNRSSLPSSTRLLAVQYGEWMFLPACAWVGWVARPLGKRRLLAFAAALAVGYTMVTQFRGSWVWWGTFDNFMFPRAPWLRASAIGIVAGLVLGFLPGKRVAKASTSSVFLALLALCVVLAAFLPRYWPNDSDFAPTRYLGLVSFLVVLVPVTIFAREEK